MAQISQSGVPSLVISELVRDGQLINQFKAVSPTFALMLGEATNVGPSQNNANGAIPTEVFSGVKFQKLATLQSDKAGVTVMKKRESGAAITDAFASIGSRTTDLFELYEQVAYKYYNWTDMDQQHFEADQLSGWRVNESMATGLAKYFTNAWLRDMNIALYSSASGEVGATKLGSIYHIVTDGLDATGRGIAGTPDDSAYKTLYGVDRSTSGGAFLRAQVGFANSTTPSAVTPLTVEILSSQIEQTALNGNCGSQADIVVLPTAIYARIREALFARGQLEVLSGDLKKFGAGRAFMFNGAVVVGDGDCPSNRIYILDSSTWEVGMRPLEEPLEFLKRPEKVDQITAKFRATVSVTCSNPAANRVVLAVS